MSSQDPPKTPNLQGDDDQDEENRTQLVTSDGTDTGNKQQDKDNIEESKKSETAVPNEVDKDSGKDNKEDGDSDDPDEVESEASCVQDSNEPEKDEESKTGPSKEQVGEQNAVEPKKKKKVKGKDKKKEKKEKEKEKKRKKEEKEKEKEKAKKKLAGLDGTKKKKKKKEKNGEVEDEEIEEKREENDFDQKESFSKNQDFEKMVGPRQGDENKDKEVAASTTSLIMADKKNSTSNHDQSSSTGVKSIGSAGKQPLDEHTRSSKENKDVGQEELIELDKSTYSSTDQHFKESDGVKKEVDTGQQTDRQNDRQTDQQTDRQNDRQTDQQTDRQNDRQTDTQEQLGKGDTDDKSSEEKMDTAAGEEENKKEKTGEAHAFDQNLKNEVPEDSDREVEIEIGSESEQEEKSMQNTLVTENGGNLEGSPKIEPQQDGDGKGMFSKICDGAKSLLGYPPKQETPYSFYVSVQDPAYEVNLHVWSPFLKICIASFPMKPLENKKIYWSLPVSSIPGQFIKMHFCYSVKAPYGTFDNFFESRAIGKARSHFTVFRYPNFPNEFTTGLFYFVRLVYRRFCNKELTLKQSIEEYDHINFGCPDFSSERRRQVASWIEQVFSIKESSETAIFFAHVIQHFDNRLLQSSKKKNLLLKQLIQDDCAIRMIQILLDSDKNLVKGCIPNAGHLIGNLLGNVQSGVSLQYAVDLCFFFGVGVLDHLSGNSNWNDEEDFLLKDELYASLDENGLRRLLGFIVKRAPTISFTWKLYDGVNNAFPSYIRSNFEMFKKTCTKLLLSRQVGKLPNVLQKTSWETFPKEFKADFVILFLEALIDQIREKKPLGPEEEDAVISFFTDEAVLSNEKAKEKFFDASKTPEMHTVVISVLQNPNSSKLWEEVKEEIRTEVYNSLIKQAFSHHVNTERGDKKSKVHGVLESLHEIFIALDVCPCPKASESIEAKCLDFFSTVDLENITEEFEIVKEFHSDVENIYLVCLQRCIEREVKRDHNHDNIVKLLERFSMEDEGKSNKLKRITHDVLFSLCNETKVLNETGKIAQHDFFLKIFHGVFVNRNLWSVLMDVMPMQSQESESPKQLEVLRQAILSFEYALKTKDIKIKDLKKLSTETYKDLLGKIHGFFTGKKCHLEDLISSCVNQEKNVYEELDQLLHFLNFINKITEKIVAVSDIDDILQETMKKRKNYDDMSLKDVLDEDYWSCAESLLESRDRLRELEEYRVFYNAAQARLAEEMALADTSECSLREVMIILTDEGISYLTETCKTLFTNPGLMLVTDAQCIMSGVTDLKKELDYICRKFEDQSIHSDAEKLLQRFQKFPSIHENVKALNSVLESLKIPQEDDLSDFVSKHLEDYEDIGELYDATEEVVDIEEPLHGSYGDVIIELSGSTELIKLLRETANDDVRNLIDAVEVHSDTTVAAKEVSDFIEIHKFLSPVLKAEPRDFFKVLTERLQTLGEAGALGIAARIKDSGNNAHSLRNIYKNVANRGEMTKEIVGKALNKGKYKINSKDENLGNLFIYHERSEEEWEYSLSYLEDEDEEDSLQGAKLVKHDMEKLQDLKSRALLIVNTEKKQQNNTDETVDFQSFIKVIDLLNEIIATGEELQTSGHPDYKTYWEECETLAEIEDICKELKEDLQDWEKTVRSVRESNFFLNFFHTKQLWALKEFFDGSDVFEDEAFSLLRFVDNSITRKKMTDFQENCQLVSSGQYEDQFNDIAIRLEEFFGREFYQEKSVEKDEKQGLFVVPLEKDSTKTASVVMQLFENANASPEPKRVLFCHGNSTWYEIELFLRRCFQENSTTSGPYCLANVESLTTDLQFQLIDSIREFQTSSKTNYWLALICRGGQHHHIVNQFRECSKNIPGMSDVKLRRTFKELFPEVSMVTSDLPGLGKTELIHERALENRKRITCFSINGPVSREKLVHRLLELGIDEECLLHIDISEVDDPLLVDTFLFELIVLGMVSSGTKLFHIPTHFIAIEVANTLQHSLRDSLSVTKCFHRVHEEWSFDKFMCSQENGSAIQVVCHYLKAYDNQTLEKDSLTLKDLKEATPLKESECRDLISKHFHGSGDLCYNVIETFLNVLATQLRKFSASQFFRPEHLKDMLGEEKNVRVSLFEALRNVSVEFATRSVGACKEVQAMAVRENDPHLRLLLPSSQKGKSAAKMVDRVKGMVKWADENHLVLMFQEALSISALFRELGKVPEQVIALFKSQNDILRDLGDLSEKELTDKLKKILFADTRSQSKDIQSYVLTPDNILKMVLIIQRIRAGVPVIVMGETGCGKTSLVRYLANSCGVPIEVLNFHAGIYEKDIVEFTEDRVKEAGNDLGKQVWVFFDEINTCDYLGLINDIICHRTLNGKELPPNLVFIAACNPYCLRPTDSIVTAGLTGKSLTDEYSNLVYRVKPLPETMMDYVWDYGSLDSKDERVYIERMVDELNINDPDLVVDLLAASQAFIREVEGNPYCVSLRDVRRCILLAKWFMKMINDRPALDVSKLTAKARDIYEEAQSIDNEDRSIVLALAHSYQSRIPSSKKRKEYRLKLEAVYTKHHQIFSAAELDLVIRAEQEEYLARMELPEGTARNTALRENVFVILVCILNRIPVFVVGKPGCSKSLSMQVIRSNLRGKDSKDEFFKTLPQLLVVSYQGSESSTSEGILKVFEKAKQYKEHNKQDESIPVVLLDEVGLAEISKYNPLKVLHRLLEPEEQEFPDVAVVGISNWALDAAKMNRAIHLSRPEPTYEDLKETGMSILEAQLHTLDIKVQEKAQEGLSESKLDCLARSYFEYQKNQIHENFHGLRDYYSLIKCLSRTLIAATEESERSCCTFRALQRNFGGLTMKEKSIDDIYAEKSESQLSGILETRNEFPVTDLISDNLVDPSARHLMLITSGDSALTIMDKTLADLSREKVIIYGSKFEEDISEDYSYRILSRIILHMEQDCVLVLRDLESVYGSLYDMLNQNYVVVGNKKNCRVALGPYSNPMCQVNDGFRCIVLVDEDKVDYTDPPFLNRFEKQLLRYSDVLGHEELNVISKLKRWTKAFCRIEKKGFSEKDVFLGFQDDTLASLVLLLRQRNIPMSELFQVCKKELMAIATPEGVLRSLRSDLFKDDPVDVKEFYEGYFFRTPVHEGLKGFIDSFKQTTQTESTLEYPSLKYFVMTHSSIHTDVEACLKGAFTCQVEKLGAFKSEKQLSKHIQMFWTNSDKDLLVFQCKPNLDGEHISLMKSILEQQHERYLKSCYQEGTSPAKSICIVIHLQKGDPLEKTKQWQFNFLREWKQATLDSLEEPEIPINMLLGESVFDLMKTKKLSLKKIIADKLMWCFTRLKYPQDLSDQESLNGQVTQLQSSKVMMKYLEKLVLRWIQQHHDKVKEGEFWSSNLQACDWQINVSCDKKALLGSLAGALQRYIDQLVRRPLAKAVYLIANRLTFESCQRALKNSKGKNENERFLAELIEDEDLFNIDEVPDPQDAKCYVLTQTKCCLNFPFSIIFFERIGSLREKYLEEWRQRFEKEEVIPESEAIEDAKQDFFQELCTDIKNTVPQLFGRNWLNDNLNEYIEDVLDYVSVQHSSNLSRPQRIKVLKAACVERLTDTPETDVALLLSQIHFCLWKHGSSFLSILQFLSICPSIFVEETENLSKKYIKMFGSIVKNAKKLAFGQRKEDEDDIEADESFGTDDKTDGGLREIEDLAETLPGAKEKNNGDADSEDDEKENNARDEEDDADENDDEEQEDNESDDESDEAESDDESSEDDSEGDDDDDDDETSSDDSDDDSEDSSKENHDAKEEPHKEEDEEESYEENDNVTEPFMEIIFDRLCRRLIPTDDLIRELGSLQAWQTAANSFVSFVAKSGLEPSRLFYNLRVCSDFGNMVLSPSYDSPFPLYYIGGLSQREGEEGDLHNCFDDILGIMDDIESTTSRADEFKISFLWRCLGNCESEEQLQSIFFKACSFSKKDTLALASPLICKIIILTILSEEDAPFMDILEDSADSSSCYSFLQVLEEALTSAVDDVKGVQDCYLATICLEGFDRLTQGDLEFDVSEVSSSTSPTMKCLKTAMSVVKESRKNQDILKLLTAVSYVRNSLASIAELVLEDPSILKQETPFSSLLKYISSCLEAPRGSTTDNPRKAACMLYFLRLLRQELSLYELRRLCEDSAMLPALTTLIWSDEISRVPIKIFKDVKMKKEFDSALVKLIERGDSNTMKTLCSKLDTDAKGRKAFACSLIEGLYLSHSNQVDTVNKAIGSIIKFLPKKLAPIYKQLVFCLTGKEDFKGKELRISAEVSLSSLRKATIVLHLLAILTSECSSSSNIDRPFLSYLLDPSKAAGGYVLAKLDDLNQKRHETLVVFTCSCRTAFLRSNQQTTCPQCNKPCSPPKGIDTAKSVVVTIPDELSVSDMTPSSFRLLRILVHAALFAGMSLDTFSREKLTEFLPCPPDKAHPVEQCLKAIDDDLEVLKRLWGFNEEQVVSAIHILMEETSSLLTKPMGGPQLTDQSRKEIQKAFSHTVDQFFKSQKDNGTSQQSEHVRPSSLEAQIDEQDVTGNFTVEMRNSWLPRLFRFTKQKSLEDLCASYNKASDSNKKSHGLLGLFIQYMKVLPMIGHLYPLIKFANMLESHFGRRLGRKDSENLIGDLIKGESHYKKLKASMKEFISSWENVRSVIEGDTTQEVPHLTEMSSVSYFLVDQGFHGQYLYKAILALQRIQNEFQGKVLKLALEGSCPALDFLKKSDSSGCSSSLPIVHVQDVKRSELICFEWDDEILQHSYHDTEYGKGHEIHYDFGKIESELAGRFLIGKVYLSTDGGLRQFPYSNELFHTCANVLNDITQRLPQEPLNADQQNRLNVLRDKKIKGVQDLLDHLEVIICWLSKTSVFSPQMFKMPLVDYVKRKLPSSNLLPKALFEDPQKEYKLCHVVSMYQKLEEFLAEASVQTVHDKYRKPLSEEGLQKVTKAYGSTDQKLVVVTTLRRFIFRYLLSDQEHQHTWDPQERAVKYLSDPSLWPLDLKSDVCNEGELGASEFEEEKPTSALQDLVERFIPRSMLVCEVYSVMSLYDKDIKEFKEKQNPPQASHRKPPKSKTKLAPKFKVSGFA